MEHLRAELEKQEEAFASETERLRLENEDTRERARMLWDELESIRRES